MSAFRNFFTTDPEITAAPRRAVQYPAVQRLFRAPLRVVVPACADSLLLLVSSSIQPSPRIHSNSLQSCLPTENPTGRPPAIPAPPAMPAYPPPRRRSPGHKTAIPRTSGRSDTSHYLMHCELYCFIRGVACGGCGWIFKIRNLRVMGAIPRAMMLDDDLRRETTGRKNSILVCLESFESFDFASLPRKESSIET